MWNSLATMSPNAQAAPTTSQTTTSILDTKQFATRDLMVVSLSILLSE
jgi:hypothetical protein